MTVQKTLDNSDFLPNFCNVRVLFVIVLSAELLAIIFSLAQPIKSIEIVANLAMNSLFIQWIALTCAGLLCLFKPYLNQQTEQRAAIFSYILILLDSFVITELAWWLIHIYTDKTTLTSVIHGYFLIRSMGITAIIGAVMLRYLYIQHQWRKNIETVAISRFQALQSRIRPHFMFNCMNTIASLTRKSPALAEQAIEDLTDLFRASLSEFTNLHKIENEWILCQHYLRIEAHRLGDRLQINWDIEALPKNALIPILSLQPLLENAIYHGIERIPEGGIITIKGENRNNQLTISFSNPINHDREDTHIGNKHAQDNIRQRLFNIFDKQSNLSIHQDVHHYTVTVNLPYKPYEDIDR